MDEYMNLDCNIMHRVINLAKQGEGYVHKEPLTAAVLAKNGKIIGLGYKKNSGKQAELIALESVSESTRNASLYLNFEPDIHNIDSILLRNKIIDLGIKRIVIAMKNPDLSLGGRWASLFKDKGIEIKYDILKNEAERVNEIYLKHLKTGIPFVILKTAMGNDDGVPKSIGESQWITETAVRELLTKTRRRVMGIMTGIGTILTDDPIFSWLRFEKDNSNPACILLDSFLRIPLESSLFKAVPKKDLIIACIEKADIKKKKFLESTGAIVIVTPECEGRVNLSYLLKRLGSMGIDSLLVEGGCRVSYSVLTGDFADKILCFTAPRVLQGERKRDTSEYKYDNSNYRAALEMWDIKCLKVGRSMLIQGYSKAKPDYINF